MDALRRRIAELEDFLARQTRVQDALRGNRSAPGVSFFDHVALELAHATDSDMALVGALLPDGRHVKTIGLSVDGAVSPGFEYALEGTPCDLVIGKDVQSFTEGVGGRFPLDARLVSRGIEGYCAVPLFDTNRRAMGLIALFRRRPFDETSHAESLLRAAAARASAELERTRSEARLRTVFDSNLIGIVFWNSDGDIVDANDTFLRTVGYSRSDLDSGKVRWKDMTPPEFAAITEKSLREVETRGLTDPYEKEYLRKDGARVPVLISGSRITKTPLTGVALVLDLSARRTAEQAARETDELNRQVLASMNEGICVHDLNLRYLHFNPVMERITGVPARDVIGKHPLEVFPILKQMGIYADLERALEGERRTTADLPYHPKGSTEARWTRTECTPLRDSAGKVAGVIAVIRDVTDLKLSEDALRESERRLSEALQLTQERVAQLEEQVQSRSSLDRMVGKGHAMQEVYRRVRMAAESDVTVLLTGESGTGKELAASAVHSLSPRRGGPFVGVNCSALPEGILESELFGHVKGAFTGASRDKVGLFQAAEGGTLFLDEVGDMSPLLQVKVLRALQEREIRRVGDDRVQKINVRVVTATNRNLPELLRKGQLREDFYYRIRVFEIRLPPLRERKEDLPILLDRVMEDMGRFTGKKVRGIEPDALKALLHYSWPGNVRELRNAVEHAFVTVARDQIRVEDLPIEIRSAAPAPLPTASRGGDPDERARIVEALHRSGGRKAAAARRLGISRVTLWHRMTILGVDPTEGLEAPPDRRQKSR